MSLSEKFKLAAITAETRGEIYGDPNTNFQDNGRMLAAMFPQGLSLNSPEDFSRFILFSLLTVKLCRYATNFTKGGHQDSMHDLGVYSFILEDYDDHSHGR